MEIKKIILDARNHFTNSTTGQELLIIPKRALGNNICKFIGAEVSFAVEGKKEPTNYLKRNKERYANDAGYRKKIKEASKKNYHKRKETKKNAK